MQATLLKHNKKMERGKHRPEGMPDRRWTRGTGLRDRPGRGSWGGLGWWEEEVRHLTCGAWKADLRGREAKSEPQQVLGELRAAST